MTSIPTSFAPSTPSHAHAGAGGAVGPGASAAPATPAREAREPREPREQGSELRAEFLRRLGHDIASPTGVTLTVLEQIASMDRPKPELLAMARRNLKRLIRLSEQLSLAAEVEMGPVMTEPQALDARELVKGALDDAVALEGRKNVHAALAIPDVPLVAPIDPRLLRSIVREVIGNALKCASGRVDVSLARVGTHLVIRIEDDGPGFSDESKATFGRRFVRRKSARGLGLSLSLAVDILHAHRGTLVIDEPTATKGPQDQRGAAVVIRLPVAPSESPPGNGAAHA